MSNTISIVIPPFLHIRARELGVNISKICQKALSQEVTRIEYERETGSSLQATNPATTQMRGNDNVIA
jgi:post-segregation antitoxin (ccd killing protein)